VYHNLERGLGGSGALPAHPWWLYGARLLLDLLPWSLLLPAAGWYFSRGGRWRQDAEARFGAVWLLTVLVLVSCMRLKRAGHLLPAYPGAALLLGCAAERWYRAARRPGRLAAAFGLAIAGCLAGWWVYLERFIPEEEGLRQYRHLAAEARRRSA